MGDARLPPDGLGGGRGHAEIDAAWSTEAEDRLRAYERGDIEALPADGVFRRIQRPPSK